MSGIKIKMLNINRTKSKNITFSVTFNEKSLQVIPSPYGYIIQLEDCPNSGDLGGPGLPAKILKVALPVMTRAHKVSARIKTKIPVGEAPVFVTPVQKPQPAKIPVVDEMTYLKQFPQRKFDMKREDNKQIQTVGKIPAVIPDGKLYKRAIARPKPVAELIRNLQLGTVNIAIVEVNPVRYIKDGKLEFSTEIEITVFYEEIKAIRTGEPDEKVIPRYFKTIRTKKQAEYLTDLAKDVVINPDIIVDFSDYFHVAISQLDYLIITDNKQWNAETIVSTTSVGDLKNAFQKLADWKYMKGLKAHVVSIEEIVNGTFGDFMHCANGLDARDLQEVIRNFIKWAHSEWDISWVLLGGDVSIIPVRQVPGASEGHMEVKTNNPPNDNQSYWTGSYLRMHVVHPGTWWPGSTGRVLIKPDTGTIIPYDAAGTSNSTNPGWYYCTSDTYATRTTTVTEYVRVNGQASLLNNTLQWIYQWNYIPTDLYYASLEGPDYDKPGLHDWDLTNNSLYGQHTDSVDLDGDIYDTDVSVGRIPVSSVDQANAFINKLIAYEQYRRPDGTLLSSDWPKKLNFISSNWGGRFGCYSTINNPPEDNRYYHQSGAIYTLINTKDVLPEYTWRLIAQVSETDLRYIPYNLHANTTGYGWFYAKSASDLTPSVIHIDLGFIEYEFPIPTKWVAVYSSGSDLTPELYIFDTIGADGSMSDEEQLRKQMAADLPTVNIVTRIYEDEVDLPPADAAFPTIEHLTDDNVRNSLNSGPHFVSLSGHGGPDGCCWLSGSMVSGLTNGYQTFIAFADSCLTNQFEGEDAMSEHLIYNANGGAIGYVGNTRFSWIGVGDNFQRTFFRTLKISNHLGYLNDSRCALVNEWTGFYKLYNKWVIFAQNLLGDPEMEVWVGSPQALNADHASSIYTGNQSFKVTVTKGGSKVSDATVCLKIEGGLYATGKTNAYGVAAININPIHTGMMQVVATYSNAIPYIGQVEIKEKPTCNLKISCGAAIMCSASIICGPKLTCANAILGCHNGILCGAKINPCQYGLACNLSINPGCLNLLPEEFDKFKDILELVKQKTFEDLVKNFDTPQVKEVIAKLSPERAKELRILVERLRNEL